MPLKAKAELALKKVIPDRPREACGVCGGWAEGLPMAYLACLALFALQHRGQESAGLAAGDGRGGKLWLHRGMGLVSEVFTDLDGLRRVEGPLVVGHVRYAYGREGRRPENSQPLLLKYRYGQLAVSHNGRLLNGCALRRELEEQGAIFQTGTDSEILAHLVARQAIPSLEEALAKVVPRLQGAFAFVVSDGKKVIGIRDGRGCRPLALAALGDRGYFLASETCALETVGGCFLREVAPGEMVILGEEGLQSRQLTAASRTALCLFELIYFARPDSILHGRSVHAARRELGRLLAREQPARADLVSGVPDSSIPAASGYAAEAALPYEMALVKNRYIGRIYIEPTLKMREEGVDLKLNAVQKVVQDKRVVLVDDSMVLGTTSRKLVRLMRRAGAREVHLRVSSPPVISSCSYGIDMPPDHELISYRRSPEEIARLLGADSVGFLSPESVEQAVGLPAGTLCWDCFT